LKEAYSVFGLNQYSSQEDVKKKYRELTKKYHPDLNKESGAEDKFKKINEAYEKIQKGEDAPNMPFGFSEDIFSNFPFSNFSRVEASVNIENIPVKCNLNFKESILGVSKEISFERKIKCSDCSGSGYKVLDNGCTKCKGKGQIPGIQGNTIFIQTCDKCRGKIQRQSCKPCESSGSVTSQTKISVTIPGGVSDGNILRLQGIGNYAGSFMGGDQYSDAHVRLYVDKDPELTLVGDTVVTTIQISLLEALQGSTKTIKTVLGNKEINIKPLSKHNDMIIIPNVGVNGNGIQKVILDVSYPKDTSKLINVLI
jgi:molecular chaperone DnaJ